MTGRTLDCAIVGAGVSGLYVAWRLALANAGEIGLFEATARPGGRLLSRSVPGTEFKADLGAMRLGEKHLILRGLITQLKLDELPFSWPGSRLFLRGQWLDGDRADCESCGLPRGIPYRLQADELIELSVELKRKTAGPGAAPAILVERAIRLALTELKGVTGLNMDKVTPPQWGAIRRRATLRQIPLYNVGFWNLLQYYLSPEAVLFVRDALGYESIVCNWNAAEAIRWFLDDFKTGYKTIKGGMQELATRLYNEVSARQPSAFKEYSRLTEIRRETHGFRLTFENMAGDRKSEYTRRVILALPKQPLQKLRFVGCDSPNETISRWERELLESVTAHELFKLFLAYHEPWWSVAGGKDRVVTDLPVRQVYYYPSASQHSSKVVVMASYNDGHYVDFWRPLVAVPKGCKRYYKGDRNRLARKQKLALKTLGIGERLAMKAHRQLEVLHGANLPPPFTGLAMDWIAPGALDGWHTWNVPCKSWKTIEDVRQPFNGLDLYVCGEAFSAEQGWIEGALRSAEGVLKTIGISAPQWIRKLDYQSRSYEDYADYVDCPDRRQRKNGRPPIIGNRPSNVKP